MKKLLSTLLVLLSSMYLTAQTATAPAGTGTAADPYRISNLENLYWLSQTSAQWVAGKYFIQIADIDASATSTWFSDGSGGYYGFPCIGGSSQAAGNHVSGNFAATYDGQGFNITNLYIKRAPQFVALFGYSDYATFKNIKLVNPIVNCVGDATFQGRAIFLASGNATLNNVHIIGGQLNATLTYGYAGSMLGRTGYITATNCSSSATVVANGTSGSYVGGFIGSPDATSTFTDCSFTGSVTASGNYNGGFVGQPSTTTLSFIRCFSTGNVTAGGNSGGFTGAVYGGTYTDCYATGNVSAATYGANGGFGAFNLGGTASFTRCYSKGSVNGASSGGFNAVAGSHTYTSCFWDTETSGKALGFGTGSNANVVGKTTAQMKTAGTFTGAGWDFYGESANGTNDYWLMDAAINSGYPSLTGNIREWIGTTSTDWNTTTNWKGGLLPASGSLVILGSSATNLPAIPGDLTLSSFDFNSKDHVFDLGNNNLTVSSIFGYGTGRYVKTSGTGKLKINIATGTLAVFPAGNSSLNTVYINNNSGSADVFSVKVIDEVYANGSDGAAVGTPHIARTWDISKAAANAGSGVKFIFNWNPADASGSMITPKLYHYGSSWAYQSGTTTSTSTSLTYTGYTGTFSPFAVIEGNVILPVNELQFAALKNKNSTDIRWQTGTEVNTSAFILQRSADGTNWIDLINIPAAGNSNTTRNYSFTDQQPVKGVNYYRLLLLDIDGNRQFSKIVRVLFDNRSFQLVTNVVTDGQLRVNTEIPGEYKVYNSKGQLIMRSIVDKGIQTINVSILSKGIYYLRNNTFTETFIVN